ncbi:hypothetical protein B0H17DRAFT_1124060 [Mycena rosella]|uniref:Uncharacterized protein n=1 Tax=Mycena rosella TaxID=1033263 RepID=A0AAD7H0C7_MYCRO|nr:hypothetical protein B0H17DRAFT_1124060 [Mycena rosella]
MFNPSTQAYSDPVNANAYSISQCSVDFREGRHRNYWQIASVICEFLDWFNALSTETIIRLSDSNTESRNSHRIELGFMSKVAICLSWKTANNLDRFGIVLGARTLAQTRHLGGTQMFPTNRHDSTRRNNSPRTRDRRSRALALVIRADSQFGAVGLRLHARVLWRRDSRGALAASCRGIENEGRDSAQTMLLI